MIDNDFEQPVADSVEQHQDAIPGPDGSDDNEPAPQHIPLEANEADVAEQARGLDLGDDDYR